MLDSLRQALRALLRQPRLTLLSILILGLGLGLATGVHSLASGLLLRGLPFPGADRLVAVGEFDPREPDVRLPVRLSSLWAWAPRQRSLEGLAPFRASFTYVRWPGGGTDTFVGAEVAPELFRLLRVRAQVGRLPAAGDCGAGEPVAVISDAIWSRRFGRSRSILGAVLGVNRQPHTVVGVMPPGFGFPFRQDVWTLLCPRDLAGKEESQVALFTLGRLRRGASLSEAKAEFNALAAGMAPVPTDPATGATAAQLLVRVEPYLDSVTDAQMRRALAAVGAGAGLLLVVCCGTVALLLLLAGQRRRRSLAVRAALGAPLARLRSEAGLASLWLCLGGGLLGLGVAEACVVLFNRLFSPSSYLRGFWVGVRLDGPSLAMALGAALLAVPLAGLLPAFRAARADPMDLFRRSAAGGSPGLVGWPGRLLVGGQVALSCVLLVGSAVTASSGWHALRAPYGYDPAGLVTAKLSLYGKEALDKEPARAARIYARALERVRGLAGVRAAALATALPGQVYARHDFVLPEEDPEGARRSALVLSVTPGYASTLGLPLLAGRDFGEGDDAEAPPVLLVNRAFTRRYLGGDLALGQEVGLIRRGETAPTWHRLIGVVGDSALGSGGPEAATSEREAIYLPLAQSRSLSFTTCALLVRSTLPPAKLADPLRREAHAIEPDLAVWEVETLSQILERESWVSRAFAGLFGVFGLAAATMACAGLYGVMALDVRERRRDFGIRRALGAQSLDLAKLVLRRGAPELLLGLAAGVALALALLRRFAAIFRNAPAEPGLVAGAVALLLLAGVVALLFPIRQALHADPLESMRPAVEEG